MTITSLKNKLFPKRSNSIDKSQDDDKSCATVPIDESWRSTSSEATPQPIESNNAPRRSSLKGLNSNRPKRPSITFCEVVEVIPIVPTTKLIRKKSELWFGTKDYERIQANLFDIVDQAEQGTPKSCTRGLENLKKDQTALYNAWDAVLGVQLFQRETGVYNDEKLSNIYKLSCANSRVEARFRARQDEKEAMEYLNITTG
jgi:hypothetical protein